MPHVRLQIYYISEHFELIPMHSHYVCTNSIHLRVSLSYTCTMSVCDRNLNGTGGVLSLASEWNFSSKMHKVLILRRIEALIASYLLSSIENKMHIDNPIEWGKLMPYATWLYVHILALYTLNATHAYSPCDFPNNIEMNLKWLLAL